MIDDKNNGIKREDKFIRNEADYLHTQVDGEAVIMNMETGSYFGLNTVATDIWNILEKPVTIQALLDQIVSEYDVDRAKCEEETLPLLDRMNELNIIRHPE